MVSPLASVTSFTISLHRRVVTRLVAPGILALVGGSTAFADTQPPATQSGFSVINSGFSLQGTAASGAAGSDILNTAGNTLTGVGQIIAGPILWIVMLFIAIFGVWSFSQGKMQMMYMAIGAVVLLAFIKAVFYMIM